PHRFRSGGVHARRYRRASRPDLRSQQRRRVVPRQPADVRARHAGLPATPDLARGGPVSRALVVAAALVAAHAGCSSKLSFDPGGGGDAGSPFADQCQVSLGSVPTEPVAAPGTGVEVTATTVHAAGPLTYTWQVAFEGQPVAFSTGPARSIIDFVAEN